MRSDILLDEANELQVSNGDFVIGQSDQQHVQQILEAFKGEYKQFPLVGFGILKYLKRENFIESEFKRDLKIQLENDGYSDALIDLSGGFENLKIEI